MEGECSIIGKHIYQSVLDGAIRIFLPNKRSGNSMPLVLKKERQLAQGNWQISQKL